MQASEDNMTERGKGGEEPAASRVNRGTRVAVGGFNGITYMPLCRCSPTKARPRLGQSLIETLAGFVLLIPIGLFSYDLTYILIANQNNERLADNAARAAANYSDPDSAQIAAQRAIDDFQQSSSYGKVSLNTFAFNQNDNGQVLVIIDMDVNIPIVFGSWRTMGINAHSVQPIVGIPAAR